jgi:uncharacterized protein (DUF1697 family)
MDTLRDLFSTLGFSNVETFIASGNVIFESKSTTVKSIEKKIESCLESKLGYAVSTFVRTDKEVCAISAYQAFSAETMETAQALNIGFLADPLIADTIESLMTLKTDIDDLHVNGRELYWLCRKKQSESTLSNRVCERAIKASATFRSATTIAKLAAKYR